MAFKMADINKFVFVSIFCKLKFSFDLLLQCDAPYREHTTIYYQLIIIIIFVNGDMCEAIK